jgi:dTDP-4-amino-4,6-dideoxygalactose transaminase
MRQIGGEILGAIQEVLKECSYVGGRWIKDFEADFARYCEATHACATASGTAALHLALMTEGITSGDDVLTTPYTFIATAEAISYVGATPVFVDILPGPCTIDPEKIGGAMTEKTKAVIPVHLYGQPADMNPIEKFAKRYGLKIIEDACQAHGARYHGHRLGSLGHMTCFSFYPSKNLGALGDAGAVVTDNAAAVEKVRMLRDHGQKGRHLHEMEGLNARMDSIQAAVLLIKLRYLEEWNKARQKHAGLYDELLGGIEEVRTPEVMGYATHAYYLYTIRARERDRLREFLLQREIMTGVYYPLPLHLQPAYRHLGYKRGDFPVAEACAEEVLALPMYPELTEEQLVSIAESIREFYQGKR